MAKAERWYFAVSRDDLKGLDADMILTLLRHDAATVECGATLGFYIFSNEGGPTPGTWRSYGITNMFADRDEARLRATCRERERRAVLVV